MNKQSILIFTLSVFFVNIQAQDAPPPPEFEATDSAVVEEEIWDAPEEMEAVEMATPEIMVDDYFEEAEADYAPADYDPFSRFTKKDFSKIEEKPDVIPSYKPGIGALFSEIQEELEVPYSYNKSANFVFIEVTIGTDSLIYNPVVKYSPGSNYSNNAAKALKKLEGKFKPAMKNGKPVVSKLIIPIRFEYFPNNND